jgi:hypothetical protein
MARLPRYRPTPRGAVAAYAPAIDGPFRCDHCENFVDGDCNKPELVEEAKMLRGLPRSRRVAPVEDAALLQLL